MWFASLYDMRSHSSFSPIIYLSSVFLGAWFHPCHSSSRPFSTLSLCGGLCHIMIRKLCGCHPVTLLCLTNKPILSFRVRQQNHLWYSCPPGICPSWARTHKHLTDCFGLSFQILRQTTSTPASKLITKHTNDPLHPQQLLGAPNCSSRNRCCQSLMTQDDVIIHYMSDKVSFFFSFFLGGEGEQGVRVLPLLSPPLTT